MSTKTSRRILLVDIGAPFGGVETYILGLAALLNNEAEVFAICGLPELTKALRAQGVRVFSIPIVGSRLSNLLRFLITAVVLPFLIVMYRIDIVQVNGYLESLLVLPARLLGCLAIRTAHGPSELDLYKWYRQPTKYFPRLAASHFLRLASRVICVSETVGKQVLARVPAKRVVTIPNWVPQMPARPSYSGRRSLGCPVSLLHVGRLERYKGLYLLFEALKGLDGMSLVVVGDGGYRGELEKLSEGLDVTFVGFSVDTERYYRSADLFINPSLGPEGLPIVSLESMAYGLPCIFSSLPVHEEISDGGEAALLFRVGDAAHLRSRIAEVRDDAALRERLAFKARAVVEARYSPAAATTAYLRAFDLSSKPHDSDVDHDANLDSIKSR